MPADQDLAKLTRAISKSALQTEHLTNAVKALNQTIIALGKIILVERKEENANAEEE